MTRGKLISAALFFGILGTMLLMPPLVLLFNVEVRFFGVPVEVIYLFAVWLVLVLGTAWFAYRLPDDREDAG
ncbi:MAG TPA: hypothetical protein VIN06_00860 [Devosia sp.]